MQFKNNYSCNYLTVTGTIILELHSNVCDYLYKSLPKVGITIFINYLIPVSFVFPRAVSLHFVALKD